MQEVAFPWFKSSYSGDDVACVEAANVIATHGVVPVRDSKDTSGPILTFSPGAFAAFIGEVKEGTYDNGIV